MKYTMDRSGIGRMMKDHPGIHRVMISSGHKTLAVARSKIHNVSGELSRSGSVEDLGVRPVFRGEPRMTVAVVFRARYAMDYEDRTGFLSGSVGRHR